MLKLEKKLNEFLIKNDFKTSDNSGCQFSLYQFYSNGKYLNKLKELKKYLIDELGVDCGPIKIEDTKFLFEVLNKNKLKNIFVNK